MLRLGVLLLLACSAAATIVSSQARGKSELPVTSKVITEQDAEASLKKFCQARAVSQNLEEVSRRAVNDIETSGSVTPEHGEKCDPCKWIGKHAIGQCEEHCTCSRAGKWVCCRVRKEFSTMSQPEVQRYLRTYLTLTTRQPHKRRYDAMVAKHYRLFSKTIHHWPQFWPWHRYFTIKFENMLRRINCKVTLPYWDFTMDWKNPWSRPMWDPQHLGGSGNPDSDYCVMDGPFRRGKWRVTPSAGSGCLKRRFDVRHTSISPRVLTLGTYTYTKPGHIHNFEKIVSVYMHSFIHVSMGGIMATHKSANEPSFWMLHSFADKLWGNWQQRGRSFMQSPYVKLPVKLSDQEDNDDFSVGDMVDLSDLPSAGAPTGGPRMAICYAGFKSVANAYRTAHMHALPVPRSYAREYTTKKSSIMDLYRSILHNSHEKPQFKRMVTEPFKKGYKNF